MPSTFLGAADNPDFTTRLRCVLFAHPTIQDVSLPAPMFVSPVAISLTSLLRSAAAISFDEQVDNSSRMITQFKYLCRQQSCYQI